MAFSINLNDKEFRLYIKNIQKNFRQRNLILMAARQVASDSAEKRFRQRDSEMEAALLITGLLSRTKQYGRG